jgi:cysteine-rich repeat protein
MMDTVLRTAPTGAAALASIAALVLSGSCLLDGEGGFGPDDVLQPPPKRTSGGAAGGGTGATGGAGGGMGGVGGSPPGCGDGVIAGQESCDDGNATANDGCSQCNVDPGYDCTGEPSTCTLTMAQRVTVGPNLGLAITDQSLFYNGTTSTMMCVNVFIPDNGHPSVQSVELDVLITHPWVGDLVIKLVSPQNTISTMLSRPGYTEVTDTYDAVDGDGSDLSSNNPITFRDGENDDAETMGNSLNNNQVVCRDDNRCDYAPNSGAAIGNGLADFDGEDPVGNWRVCVGDAAVGDVGTLNGATLTVLSW